MFELNADMTITQAERDVIDIPEGWPDVTRFPLCLDNTMVSAYRSCPTKFMYNYARKLSGVAQSVHLVAGAAFARGLEVTRKEFFDKGTDFATALARGAAALVVAYGDFQPNQFQMAKSVENMIGALGFYFDTWPINRIIVPYKQENNTHAIEWSFAIPIPGVLHPDTGEPLLYAGRFDMVGVHEYGMLLGEDDKTTSQLGDQWFKQWPLANQVSGYCWAAQEYGIPLAGFNLRGVSLLKNNFGHADAITYRRAWMIKAFLESLTRTVKDMIRDYGEGKWEQSFGNACSQFGGCSYFDLCNSPNPEDWISQYYVPNTWNPMASRD